MSDHTGLFIASPEADLIIVTESFPTKFVIYGDKIKFDENYKYQCDESESLIYIMSRAIRITNE